MIGFQNIFFDCRFIKRFDGVMHPAHSHGIPDYYLVFDPVAYVKHNQLFQMREIQGTEPAWEPWLVTDFAKRLEVCF